MEFHFCYETLIPTCSVYFRISREPPIFDNFAIYVSVLLKNRARTAHMGNWAPMVLPLFIHPFLFSSFEAYEPNSPVSFSPPQYPTITPSCQLLALLSLCIGVTVSSLFSPPPLLRSYGVITVFSLFTMCV